MRSLAVALALVASACAYSVSQPSGAMGWTNSGAQPLTWSRVNTDPANFTVVLTNQDRSVLPQDQVLIAEQDGVGQTKASCNPPSGGWPVGNHFRINLVKDVEDQNTILAQSDEFSIKAPNTTSSVLNISPTQPAPTGQVPPPSITSNTSPNPSGAATPPPNGATTMSANAAILTIIGGTIAFFIV